MRVVMILGLLAFAACSSSSADDDSAPVTDTDAATSPAPTAAPTTTPAPVSDAGNDAHDAEPADAALPLGESVTVENARTPMSCDAVCAASKFTCGSTKCSTLDGALGIAAYLGGNSTNLACADVPASINGGETFTRVDCCCVIPYVLYTGTTSTKDCTDVCTSHSLKCDATHDWGKAGTGGLDVQYERPSTTAVTDYAEACTKIPTATIDLTKPTEKGQLTKYSCACVAP